MPAIEDDVLAWAEFYLERGLNPIPVKYKEKQPAIEWKPYQNQKVTPYELKKWFRKDNPLNIGLLGGKISENLAIADCDSKKAFQEGLGDEWLDKTLCVETNRGIHVYFKTKKPTPTTHYEGIDVIGDGGLVIAPPSIHPSGKQYRQISSTDIVLEVEDLSFLKLPAKPKSQTEKITLSTVIREGERNNAAFNFARRLRDDGVTANEALSFLVTWNEKRVTPPLPEEELQKTVESAYSQQKEANADEIKIESAKEILERKTENIAWVVEKLIPKGSVIVLGAKRATFKTSSTLHAGIKAARGEKAFNHFKTTKTKCLLLDGESGYYALPMMLKRVGAKPTDNLFSTDLFKFNLLRQTDAEKLKEVIKKNEIGLVIIDSLRRALRGDENDSAVLSKFLTTIKNIASETGAAFVIIHHERKQLQGFKQDNDSFDQLDALRGSGDIAAAADVVIQLKRQGLSLILELTITKSRFTREGEPYTLVVNSQEINGAEILDFFATEGTVEETDTMKTKVLKWLWDTKKGEVTTADLQEKWAESFSERSVSRLVTRLKDEGVFMPIKRGTHGVDSTLVKDYLVSVGEITADAGQRQLKDDT